MHLRKYTFASILTEVLSFFLFTLSITAQADPPQRGNRYLPGEEFRARCFVASSDDGSTCSVLISPENIKCGLGDGRGTLAYPAPDKKNPNDYLLSINIPALPLCPTIDQLTINFGKYQHPSHPCSGYIPGLGTIPIVPLDSMTMTYPENSHSIIEIRSDTTFFWFKTFKAQEFNFQLSTNKDFIPSRKLDETLTSAVLVDTVLERNSISLPLYKLLKKNAVYYWRIRPKKNNQWLEWSAYTQFTARNTIQTGVYDEQTSSKLSSFVDNNVLTLTDVTDHVNMDKLRISLVSLHGSVTEVPSSSFSFNDSDIVINIESLTTGWYTLILTDNTKTRVTTFIKQ